ncbi:MAG: SCP2 domain-containing protein [Candidatus Berkiellales bacterium]
MEPISLLAKGILPLINAVISRLDDEAWKLLVPHENKIVCFQIETLPPLYFQIQPGGLVVIAFSKEQHVDLTFSGPFSAFIALVFTHKRMEHGLHVKGDIDCAKALYDTWRYLDLDWEGYLAQFVGGDLAHLMSKSFRQWQSWMKRVFDDRVQDLGAYLTDESNWLPTQAEVNKWIQDIDTLRLDVSRFEAKLNLLLQHYSER